MLAGVGCASAGSSRRGRCCRRRGCPIPSPASPAASAGCCRSAPAPPWCACRAACWPWPPRPRTSGSRGTARTRTPARTRPAPSRMPRFQPTRKRRPPGGAVATWRPGSCGGGGAGAARPRHPGGGDRALLDGRRGGLAEREAGGVGVVLANVPAAVDAVALAARVIGHGVAMLAMAMTESSPQAVVGIDLGGTTIKAGLVSRGVPDPGTKCGANRPSAASGRCSMRSSGWWSRSPATWPPAAVGFGLPSQIDQRHGRVLDSTNVPLEDLDFADEMERRLGVPVKIDNDANVACLAETRIGVAVGARHVVMLTLGTGVGGGLVLDGQIYRGSIGAGGELGHMTIDEDGPPCQGHCPNRGCLEVLASATGVMAAAERIASQRPDGTLAGIRAAGEELEARLVIDRARAGDAEAADVFRVVGRHLGIGIANLREHLQPRAGRDRRRHQRGRRAAAGAGPPGVSTGACCRRPAALSVVAAKLGNDAGMLGAAALVLEMRQRRRARMEAPVPWSSARPRSGTWATSRCGCWRSCAGPTSPPARTPGARARCSTARHHAAADLAARAQRARADRRRCCGGSRPASASACCPTPARRPSPTPARGWSHRRSRAGWRSRCCPAPRR